VWRRGHDCISVRHHRSLCFILKNTQEILIQFTMGGRSI
jgi:hypothetical protein